jgi:hypothetical protein
MPTEPDNDSERIRRLMMAAFEEAFQLQIGHLYKTYLANAVSIGEQQRVHTKKGIENAIAAYRLALEAIEQWKG